MSDPKNAEFLLAAINDTEGTIRATDTKASIALVIHGLLFGALITVTMGLGGAYNSSIGCFQEIVVALLIATGFGLLVSVGHLLLCVAPTPRSAIPTGDPVGVSYFFPPVEVRGLNPRANPEAWALTDGLSSMGDAEREAQLSAELIKLAVIRQRKTVLIRRGLCALATEVGLALAYLAFLGFHAA